MKNYKDKTVLITGASSGIGESFAKQLDELGSKLILTARSEDKLNKLASQIPNGKFGKPSDVADAVGFLASNEASYITGNTLNVNGGMYMC